MTNLTNLSEKDRNSHLHPFTNPVLLRNSGPEMITGAEGIHLITSDGRRVLDASSALGNVSLGYGNERLCQAAAETMRKLSFSHTILGRSNPWAAELTAKLAEISSPNFPYFFLASTGSDAIESSVKIALRYWRLRGLPEKKCFISRRLSYHGNTLFATSLTGIETYHHQFGLPFGDNIYYADAPYWYRFGNGQDKEAFGKAVAEALEQQILSIGPENIAAFVGDPIQTGGGTIIPPDSYWPEVRRICTEYDILLIADEIVTGFGKTGKMFGFQSFDFEPDLFAMAKGLSSGYFPISAVGVGAKVADLMQYTDEVFAHIFTNSGHPVGAAVALQTIAVLEDEGLVDRVQNDIGPYFAGRLSELLAIPQVGEVRSKGVMAAIDFNVPPDQQGALQGRVGQLAWERGVATRGATLCLPLVITRGEIDQVVDTLNDVIADAVAYPA
jgi:putrescine aminotransferase